MSKKNPVGSIPIATPMLHRIVSAAMGVYLGMTEKEVKALDQEIKPNLPNLLYIGHLTYLWNPYKINIFGLFSFTFICIIDIIIFSDYTYVWGNRRGISGIFEKQKWYYIRV